MKIVTKALIALTILGGTAQASTNPLVPVDLVQGQYVSKFSRVLIDAKDEKLAGMNAGSVKVDLEKGRVTLQLERQANCPIGMFCSQIRQRPVVIDFPVYSQTIDSCGTKHIVAMDPRLLGVENTLTVLDNTENTCKTLIALSATEVTYEHGVIYPNAPHYRSTFFGEALKRVFTLDRSAE